MGINAAFSSWLRGAQSTATAALRAAQNYGATLQQQTVTALSAAQQAVTRPFQQQTRSTSRQGSTQAPYTARTTTSVDFIGGAARTIQGGVRGAQQAAQQIVRAHAPIVQGVQRDVSRAIQAAPGVIQNAPAAAQQAARQISAAHAPIVQGIQRDASRAVRSAPAAIQSAPRAVQAAAQQIARAHSPIMQGIQRDAGRAAQAIPAPVRSAVSQIARAHAPIAQGIQRDAARAVSAGLGAATSAMNFANQRKAAAQADLTRTAGPAVPFEKGWTYPLYEWGQGTNKAYQGFVDQVYPLWSRTQPLHAIPEIRQFQRGIARAPGSFLESLTFIPPAAERAGQLIWKEPHKLPGTAAKFAGQQYEGMGAAYERDPYDFAGELIGTAALSYGIGAAARPGAVARGSGARGPGTPTPRTAAGGVRSPGGTGSRFRSLEFGYRTELVRKPATPQKPFSVAEWHKERQKYARGRAAIQVQQAPAQIQTTMWTATPPAPSNPRMMYGSSGAAAGFAARQGSRVPLAPAPQDALLDVAFAQRENPQDTRLNQGTLHPVRPALLDQDVATREKERLALVLVPLMTRPQTQDQALVTVPRPTEDRKITDPPKRRRPPVIPLYLPPPRSSTPRGKDKKKKEEEERRRRKKKGEADHWEYGPAPGINEMGMLIFGTPGRSVLNLGGSPLSYGFAPRTPAKTLAKKPAHAGEMRKKRGKATKKKK